MTDYRIDVRGGIALSGMKTGHPEAATKTIVSISAIRYNNGRELKPELLWGPAIFDLEDEEGDKLLLEMVAPYFETVIENHAAGRPTQVRPV